MPVSCSIVLSVAVLVPSGYWSADPTSPKRLELAMEFEDCRRRDYDFVSVLLSLDVEMKKLRSQFTGLAYPTSNVRA